MTPSDNLNDYLSHNYFTFEIEVCIATRDTYDVIVTIQRLTSLDCLELQFNSVELESSAPFIVNYWMKNNVDCMKDFVKYKMHETLL